MKKLVLFITILLAVSLSLSASGQLFTLGFDSPIGPVEVSLMGSNMSGGPIGFINFGYWF